MESHYAKITVPDTCQPFSAYSRRRFWILNGSSNRRADPNALSRAANRNGFFSGTDWARRSFDKARVTNPRAVLQRKVDPATGVNFGSAFPAQVLGCFGHDLSPAPFNHTSRWNTLAVHFVDGFGFRGGAVFSQEFLKTDSTFSVAALIRS
jgi:hypothetical protein